MLQISEMGSKLRPLGETDGSWHRWSEEAAYRDDDNEVYWEGLNLNCSVIDCGHGVNCHCGDDLIYSHFDALF